MRVLHLIEPSLPGLGATSLRMLHDVIARCTDHQHDVVVMGMASDLKLARRCGLHSSVAIQAPRWLPISGWRELQVLVLGQHDRGPVDVIHAWGMRPALVAAMACPRRPRVSSIMFGPRTDSGNWWLRLMARKPAMPILCASSRVTQILLRSPIASEQVQTALPGIAAMEQLFATREEVRARWRRDHGVPDDTMVIGLPADPPTAIDVHVFANAAARLNLSGRPTYVVSHQAGRRRVYSRRFLRQLNLSHVLVVDDLLAEPWRVMRGLDAAVMSATTQSPLPMLWAVAAGIPIIAEQGNILNLRDGETGLLIPQGDINAAADRMTRLFQDRSLGVRLAASAALEVGRTYQFDCYTRVLSEAWSKAMALASSRRRLHLAGIDG